MANEDLTSRNPYDAGQTGAAEDEGFWGGSVDGRRLAVEGYRRQAGDAQKRQAYQPNWNDYQYGVGRARTAADMQRNAAVGGAPSAAEIAGHAAIENSAATQAQGIGGAAERGAVRSPMQQFAAIGRGMNTATNQRGQLVADMQTGRASELARARGAYGDTATGLTGQGIQRTGQELGNEQFQRGLNDGQQQFYDNLGQNTQNAALQSDSMRNSGAQASIAGNRNNEQAEKDRDDKIWGSLSDARTKQKAPPSWLTQAQREYASGKASQAHEQESSAIGDLGVRENPYDTDQQTALRFPNDDLLDERQRQLNGDTSSSWLDSYIQNDNAKAPDAPKEEKRRARIYSDDTFGADEPGMAPGTEDDMTSGQPMDRYSKMVSMSDARSKLPKFEYSDDRTKVAAAEAKAYALGRAHGDESMRTGKSVPFAYGMPKEDIQDKNASQVRADQASRATTAAKPKPLARAPEPKKDERGVADTTLDGYEALGKNANAAISHPGVYASTYMQPNYREYDRQVSKMETPERAAAPASMAERIRRSAERARVVAPTERVEYPPSLDEQDASVAAARAPYMPPPEEKRDATGAPKEWLSTSDARTKEDAARRLASVPYSYKDEYRPKEQGPGEVNFGPMAQEMEKNPLTATSVKTDGKSGMRMVDMSKLVKTQSGLISHLQEEIDEMRGSRGR